MDKQKAAADILAHALALVPFEGWNQNTLAKAALAAGYRRTDSIRVFPGGAMDAIDAYFVQIDASLLARLQQYHLASMKVRDRITQAVRLYLELLAPHKEAVRKALAMQAMPLYCLHSLRNLYHAVDTIWYGIGDTSADFNFYTKRLTLAGVLSATMIYWLDDRSPGFENSWAFLDRRIDDVMRIEKLKATVRRKFA